MARKTFGNIGKKVSNFSTLDYRLSNRKYSLKELPHVEELPEDFVIVLDSSGLKVINRRKWIRKNGVREQADVDYDTYVFFRYLWKERIEPAILIRKKS